MRVCVCVYLCVCVFVCVCVCVHLCVHLCKHVFLTVCMVVRTKCVCEKVFDLYECLYSIINSVVVFINAYILY